MKPHLLAPWRLLGPTGISVAGQSSGRCRIVCHAAWRHWSGITPLPRFIPRMTARAGCVANSNGWKKPKNRGVEKPPQKWMVENNGSKPYFPNGWFGGFSHIFGNTQIFLEFFHPENLGVSWTHFDGAHIFQQPPSRMVQFDPLVRWLEMVIGDGDWLRLTIFCGLKIVVVFVDVKKDLNEGGRAIFLWGNSGTLQIFFLRKITTGGVVFFKKWGLFAFANEDFIVESTRDS